jgi:glycerol-3-phosphate acyltransferase PlsY
MPGECIVAAMLSGVGDLSALEWSGIVGSYLLGALPFGLVIGLVFGGVDIREIGSGNIGATNVGRAMGRPFALLAFLLDYAKGWGPAALIGPAVASSPERALLLAVLCGVAAACGHCWPVYLRFRGGKGVATTAGAMLGLDWVVFLGGGLIWLITTALFRMVGLSSLVMGLAFPLLAWIRYDRHDPGEYGIEVVFGAGALCLLIFVRHRANIVRMLAGEEPRIGGPQTGKKP